MELARQAWEYSTCEDIKNQINLTIEEIETVNGNAKDSMLKNLNGFCSIIKAVTN
jgi:hypothetical protein